MGQPEGALASPRQRSTEVLVVGAGPAGSALAWRLATWGREVLLLDDGRPRGGPPEETLVPAAASLLEDWGLLGWIQEQGFWGSPRHGTLWQEARLRWRPESPGGRGFQVVRRILDQELRRRAQAGGAACMAGHMKPSGWAGGSRQALRVEGAGGLPWEIMSKVTVLATGGGTSPAGWPVAERLRLPPTAALWTILGRDRDRCQATIIEAVPEGWWWWLPLGDGQVSVTLFCDLQELRERGRAALWEAAREASLGPVGRAQPKPHRAVLATARLLEGQGELLLGGDAASSIDPLSSQGIQKALASAKALAYVVNTWIEGGVSKAALLEHHRRWERETWKVHARGAAAWYREVERFLESPFWRRRRHLPEGCGGPEESRPPLLLPDGLCLAASLREVVSLKRERRLLQPARGWTLGPGEPVYQKVSGVPLAPLLGLFDGRVGVDELLRRARQEPAFQNLSPEVLEGLLLELVRMGFVCGGARGGPPENP